MRRVVLKEISSEILTCRRSCGPPKRTADEGFVVSHPSGATLAHFHYSNVQILLSTPVLGENLHIRGAKMFFV
jgi:hypothetical protein